MAVKKIKSMNSSELRAMRRTVGALAGTISRIIYVYSFKNPNAEATRALIPNPRLRGKKPNQTITEKQVSSPKKYTPKGYENFKRSSWETVDNVRKKWAVRIEGSAKPINKVFDTSEEALTYAKVLLQKGNGKAIEVFDQ